MRLVIKSRETLYLCNCQAISPGTVCSVCGNRDPQKGEYRKIYAPAASRRIPASDGRFDNNTENTIVLTTVYVVMLHAHSDAEIIETLFHCYENEMKLLDFPIAIFTRHHLGTVFEIATGRKIQTKLIMIIIIIIIHA